MHLVGKLNKEIYRCVSENIQAEEVIITEECIQHIKERHPNDYEKYCIFLTEIVENPDYIIETNKPNTALILKEVIGEEGEIFKTVVRLITVTDSSEFKNSII